MHVPANWVTSSHFPPFSAAIAEPGYIYRASTQYSYLSRMYFFDLGRYRDGSVAERSKALHSGGKVRKLCTNYLVCNMSTCRKCHFSTSGMRAYHAVRRHIFATSATCGLPAYFLRAQHLKFFRQFLHPVLTFLLRGKSAVRGGLAKMTGRQDSPGGPAPAVA